MKSRFAIVTANILIVILFLFLALLFCEVGYRIYEYNFYKRQIKKQDNPIIQVLPKEPILQYKLKPNSSYMLANKILYRINSKGIRDYDSGCNDNAYKIVVLGDSNTFGWAVEMQETYPKVLETILKEEGYNIKVINAGIYGYNIQQEVQYFKKYILDWCTNPDLVIFGFVRNDTHVQGVTPRHPYMNHNESYAHFWFIEFIKSRINRLINKNKKSDTGGFAKSGDFYPIKVKLADPYLSDEEAFNDKFLGYRRFKEALLEMKRLSEEKNFDLRLVILPDVSFDFRNYLVLKSNEKVSKYCEGVGIKTIDLYPFFKGESNKKLQNLEFSDEGHPNKIGHKIIAEILSVELKKIIENEMKARNPTGTVFNSKRKGY